MKITADDLMRFGVIDEIIREPKGGAHRDAKTAIKAVGEAVTAALKSLAQMDRAAVRAHRQDKFLAVGRLAAETSVTNQSSISSRESRAHGAHAVQESTVVAFFWCCNLARPMCVDSVYFTTC